MCAKIGVIGPAVCPRYVIIYFIVDGRTDSKHAHTFCQHTPFCRNDVKKMDAIIYWTLGRVGGHLASEEELDRVINLLSGCQQKAPSLAKPVIELPSLPIVTPWCHDRNLNNAVGSAVAPSAGKASAAATSVQNLTNAKTSGRTLLAELTSDAGPFGCSWDNTYDHPPPQQLAVSDDIKTSTWPFRPHDGPPWGGDLNAMRNIFSGYDSWLQNATGSSQQLSTTWPKADEGLGLPEKVSDVWNGRYANDEHVPHAAWPIYSPWAASDRWVLRLTTSLFTSLRTCGLERMSIMKFCYSVESGKWSR